MDPSHTGTPPKHEEEDDESSDPDDCCHHIEKVGTSIQIFSMFITSIIITN
jgi:hypothetical protein